MKDAADAQLELLVAELAARMDQYVACMRELPHVGWPLKRDLLHITARESYDIEALYRRIRRLVDSSPPCATTSSLSGLVRYIASRKSSAEVLIADCQVRASVLDDLTTRTMTQEWLSRARRYSEAGRRAQTAACIANAIARLPVE